ncbi:MAG: hypothetical protein NTY64_21240 [Deltaproteobacteria bacterium]|nr:hypothetical protein [Deltaproteobacteria bacterium]
MGLIASGALLIVSDARDSKKIVSSLKREGISAAVIGKIWEKEKGVKMLKQGEMLDLPIFARDEVARLFEREGYPREKNDR